MINLIPLERKFLREFAIYEVAKAKQKNKLPSARLFACVDCGLPATEYEHRDYSKPLVVVPTCHKCNIARGPARCVHTELSKEDTEKFIIFVYRRAGVDRAIELLRHWNIFKNKKAISC